MFIGKLPDSSGPMQVEGYNRKLAPDQSAAAAPKDSVTLKSLAPTVAADPTQGAEEIPGLFTILRNGDKVWISIPAEQLNNPFLFSSNVAKSLAERSLVGSEMGSEQLAEFRRAGDNRIQLVARNTAYFADPGTPQARFVSEAFSDSLISSGRRSYRPFCHQPSGLKRRRHRTPIKRTFSGLVLTHNRNGTSGTPHGTRFRTGFAIGPGLY